MVWQLGLNFATWRGPSFSFWPLLYSTINLKWAPTITIYNVGQANKDDDVSSLSYYLLILLFASMFSMAANLVTNEGVRYYFESIPAICCLLARNT